jgi:hypothetical protein
MSTNLVLANGSSLVQTHHDHKYPPILLDGNLEPADLHIWEQAANRYFTKMKVPDEEKVPNIFASFRNLGITNWIDGSKDTMEAEGYTFGDFMTSIREHFLESGWARKIYRAQIKQTMKQQQRFVDYANQVIYYNIILKGTEHHSDDAKLCETFLHNMSEGLLNKHDTLPVDERKRIREIENLNIWIREIETIDRTWKAELKTTADLMNEMLSQRIREEKRTNDRNPDTIRDQNTRNEPRDENRFHPYRSNGRDRNDRDRERDRERYNRDQEYDRGYSRPRDNRYTNRNREPKNDGRTFGTNRNGNSGNRERRCPPLTQAERDLLNEHCGCTKCRKFYVDPEHRSYVCQDWPDAHNYRTLTLQDALDAKPRQSNRQNNRMEQRNTVAATMPLGPTFDDVYSAGMAAMLGNAPTYDGNRAERAASAPPTAHIREVNAVLPSSIAFALGNGSVSSEENDFIGAVSNVAPFTVDHLQWEANVFGGNEFPTRITCLLDNGAHLVLIRPETVADLALPIRKLTEPISVTLALEGKKTVNIFHDYVHLELSSVNNEWTSRTVRALIAPHLCTNILLGLPFLTHNNIVIDHEARSATDKISGFNLMNNDDKMPRKITKKMIPPKIKVKRILENRKAMITELKEKCAERLAKLNEGNLFEIPKPINVVAAMKEAIEILAAKDKLQKCEEKIKDEFKEIFAPIPHISLLPTENMARIQVKNAYQKIANRNYSCPRQYREAFSELIQQRLDSGFIRPSSSPYASPSFVIPKADKTVLPRWVCDFRALNANTIPDNYCMPRIDDILADCAKGKIWATIDMTDSFFQTRIHPDDIHKTAVTTPFGTYEWCVMPMGLRNSPAIHQRRVTNVLRPFIGKICHIYLDDIIIWSDSMEEHMENVRTIMRALRDAKLHVNRKKTKLFCDEVDFLGHHISRRGVEADGSKVERILDWPTPKSAKEVRQFLGLVRYLNAFLPKLAIQSEVLNRLTWKECDKKFPEWTQKYQDAFDAIKAIVVSRECLTIIDHSKMPENKIFVTTDASEKATGAILSFGPSWETARPVAFDSMTLKGAELNYPVHEKGTPSDIAGTMSLEGRSAGIRIPRIHGPQNAIEFQHTNELIPQTSTVDGRTINL